MLSTRKIHKNKNFFNVNKERYFQKERKYLLWNINKHKQNYVDMCVYVYIKFLNYSFLFLLKMMKRRVFFKLTNLANSIRISSCLGHQSAGAVIINHEILNLNWKFETILKLNPRREFQAENGQDVSRLLGANVQEILLQWRLSL